jgi:iron(III) transport system substrate-binding protein
VAPVWADQDGRGAHVNLSGLGVVRGSDHAEEARELIRFLRRPAEQAVFAENNHEFPAVEGASPSPEIEQFGEFRRDPIDVDRAGARLDEALTLMDRVGWD